MDTRSLINTGKTIAMFASEQLGYDSAVFDCVKVTEDGDLSFEFNFKDEFQRDLSYGTRFQDGWQSFGGETTGEVWSKVRKLKNREQREIACMLKAIEPFSNMTTELRGQETKAALSRWSADLEAMRSNLLT